MIPAIFSRCLNLIWHYVFPACPTTKRGVHGAHSRLGMRFYFIAKQSVRLINIVYPLPKRMNKMTPCYARLLALVALVMLMASGPAFAQTDYDRDNDNLIDITTLPQLNAIRWDLNGDGAIDASATSSDTTAYNAAFSNAASGMGCQSTCTGYELLNNLDFDTDGNGSTYIGTGTSAMGDSGDDYYNGGSGWAPIGRFDATFKGNGYIISNLFIKRTTTSPVGLFGTLDGNDRVESVGVKNAYVYGRNFTGILVGTNHGTVAASWSTGSVLGDVAVGGLVGQNLNDASSHQSTIIASYSRAAVHAIPSFGTDAYVGGLVGSVQGNHGRHARVIACYSTGAVTSTVVGRIGGLTALFGTTSITASYWDTQTSGRTSGGGGTGQMTTTLKAKTDYTGIYANWNVDVDGVTGNDNPWDFGTSSQYPVLKYGGHSLAAQGRTVTDYDMDNDRLIDITTLAQLNVIRWDLNGDGAIDSSATSSDTTAYNTAFSNRDIGSARMGCPSGTCTGYELLNNLNFDQNNDGAITQADTTYWNSGQGWMPIGSDANPASRYTGDFKGNGYTVQNLFISRSTVSYQALFGSTGTNSRIESLGVTDADVTADDFSAILAGANRGEIVACYTTGRMTGDNVVGGLVGWTGGSISTSYSLASVSATQNLGGLVGSKATTGSITNSYSTGAVSLSSGSMTSIGGLLGESNAGTGTVTYSYWDTTASGRQTSFGGSGAIGRNTTQLQSPTTYGATTNDTYYNWNANIDGQSGNDDPWTFGAMDQYPVLKYAGMDTTVQFQLQPAIVTLALTPSSISENGGMSTVTATLAHPLSAATTITVRPVAGAYTVAADSTITIAAGSTANASDTVVITAVDNTQDAPNRDVDMSVVAGNAQGAGRVTATLTLTLEDDDPAPIATLAANPSSISENGAVSTVTASLSRPSSAATTITVRPVASAYTVAADSTITIAAGDTINASDTVVITAVNNTQDAPNRDVNLSGVSRNAQGAGSVTGTVTLEDDDPAPDVTMVVSPASISENGGVSTVTATLSHTSSDPTTIMVTVAPVLPAVAGDYTISTPATLTVAAGQTMSMGTVTITGVNNADATGNKTVTVSSTPTNSVGTGSVTDVTLTLTDDDVPNVTLVLTPASITENAQVSTITATLDRIATTAATVTVSAMAVSPAVAGDFTLSTTTTLTFAANVTTSTGSVTITSVNDTTDAPDKEVTVSATVTGGNMAVLSSSETLTITDDDPPPRLSISSPSAVEGTALTFTVRLNAASGKEVTVAYADASTGTATSGTDYTALTAGTLTFAAGTTSQTFAVSVSDDGDDEPNETVEVTLSNTVNATFDGGATSLTGTGTIIDNDGMPALSIGSPSVIEGATGATLTFRVYLRPAHNTLQVTVGYADAGTGSATSGTDYTALTAGTLTFTVGDTIQTIPVSVTDDSDGEQNETVIVTLSSATNATISTAQGTGTIIDDETSSANLDVDGDGRVRLFSDIILVIRYVLFFRNEALIRGNVIEPTATRKTAQEIEPYLDTLVNQNILDVDGDGDVRLFSDIILVIRYVLFFRNEALIRGNVIEPTATRKTAQEIEPYIRSLYPASHFQ